LYDIDGAISDEMMSFKMLQGLNKLRAQARRSTPHSPLDDGLPVTVRFAYPDDELALRQLAALDSQRVPTGRMLVAEVDGELWAAVSVGDESRVIANPYHHTAALVALLTEGAETLTRAAPTVAAGRPSMRTAWS
jgi:hypothetical protein